MPFPILLALAAIAATKAGTSGATASSQKREAEELERENNRPTETVPQGVLDSVAIARLMASVGMPAEQYNLAKQNIERAQTAALAASRDRRSGVDAVSTIQQATNDATLSLDAKSSEQRQQNQLQLVSSLQNLGQWQDKIWTYNKMLKYQENAAAIRALKTASAENKNKAIDSLLSFATTAIGSGLPLSGKTGGKINTTASAGGTIDTTAMTGGVQANKDMLSEGSPENTIKSVYDTPPKYKDPTLTNPELFSDGKPNVYTDYLMKLKQIQSAA